MKFYRLLPFLLMGVFFTSCGESTSESGPDTDPAAGSGESEQADLSLPFEADAIYLERMYATNTGSAGPENALDGDESSSWMLPPGAAVNEGMMLYFEKPQAIGGLVVKGPAQGNSATFVKIYTNGSEVGTTKLNEDMVLGNVDDVKSLYVRIIRSEDTQVREFSDGDGENHELTSYGAESVAMISEIQLKGPNEELLKVRPLPSVSGSVKATSTLSPPEAYHADFLFDSRLQFGWAEGKDDLGIGESLEFNFDRPVRIEKLKVWNGYQRSDKHFESNARVDRFTFSNGEQQVEKRLEDSAFPTVVELSEPFEGQHFTLAIQSAYPGTKYEDLLMSEIRFFDGHTWFSLDPDGDAARKADLLAKVKGTVLETEQLLDRDFRDRWEHDCCDGVMSNSIILRSNGSFVLYHIETDFESGSEVRVEQIADGNWSVESKDGPNVKVKLFGNLRVVMNRTDVYTKKSSSNASSRIFSEMVTIDGNMMNGTKLVNRLFYKVPAEYAE